MTEPNGPLSLQDVLHVRDTCLCFAAQRAARRLARRFDAMFRPLGITNNQFSLMMPLNAPPPMSLGQLSEFLGMDQTTISATLKGLERDGLIEVRRDDRDKRIRRPTLTAKGHAVLHAALPIWRAGHAKIDAELAGQGPDIRKALNILNHPPQQKDISVEPGTIA